MVALMAVSREKMATQINSIKYAAATNVALKLDQLRRLRRELSDGGSVLVVEFLSAVIALLSDPSSPVRRLTIFCGGVYGGYVKWVHLNGIHCYTFYDSSAHENEGETLPNGGNREIADWDDALHKSTQEYQHHSYNILTCNCHSFAANCLNRLKFQACDWNVVNLAILMFIKGHFVSKLAIFHTYFPFIAAFAIVLALRGETYLIYLALFIFVLVGWYLLGTYYFKKLIYV